jgi:hypothetical protein
LAPNWCRSTVNWRVVASSDEQASCEDASVDVVESVVVRGAAARGMLLDLADLAR